MKKSALAVFALLLSGGAHALTAGRVVKASSNTYVTDSILKDDGTHVGIGTTTFVGAVHVSTPSVPQFVSEDPGNSAGAVYDMYTGGSRKGRLAAEVGSSPVLSWSSNGTIPLVIRYNNGEVLRVDGNGVGIGTSTVSGSSFTVNGIIKSISNGFAFPDGSTETTKASVLTQYAAAVSSSVTNTAGETSIVPTGGGGTLTIPANRLAVGTAIRISVYGDYTTTGSPPTSATFKIKIGSTFFHTFVISHPPASQTTAPWKIDATYVVRSTGAFGTISGAAFLTMMNAASASPYVSNATFDGATNTAASSIDTTTTNTVDVTVQWSSAVSGNTVRAAAITVEILN